jgi:hypothetical protein
MASRNNAIEKLSTLTEFHNEVHGIVVFIGGSQSDNVRMGWHVLHDGYLTPHVFHIHGCPKLALGDGLARINRLCSFMSAHVRDAKLPAPYFSTKPILFSQVCLLLFLENQVTATRLAVSILCVWVSSPMLLSVIG